MAKRSRIVGEQNPSDNPLGLAGQVYDDLVSLILREEVRPLEPLRIHALAKQLGVSATPVREALVRASAIGIVTRENNKGFRVSPRPGAAELDDLFQARITIETATAAMAARNAGPGLVRSLEATLVEQERCITDSFDGFRAFLEADRLFHAHIAVASGNRFLASALEMLGSHVQRYRSFDVPVVTDRQETLNEHRTIINAITRGNDLAAQAAMQLHLANLRARVRVERDTPAMRS